MLRNNYNGLLSLFTFFVLYLCWTSFQKEALPYRQVSSSIEEAVFTNFKAEAIRVWAKFSLGSMDVWRVRGVGKALTCMDVWRVKGVGKVLACLHGWLEEVKGMGKVLPLACTDGWR
ncbi:hypothetical protein CYMTET_50947 [Cymbomonas tetramitiformis]|uniref:Transmembrane protein n=1 Tax=Cymbomonas tetramitiformis TaxID=36881 RepID=A0AAE0BNC6_9CHLO|nr:hypothetical protein CYMTET_50947 [Cymbomonas tetramitiformis]